MRISFLLTTTLLCLGLLVACTGDGAEEAAPTDPSQTEVRPPTGGPEALDEGQGPGSSPSEPQPAPEVEFTTMDGQQFSLSDRRGEVVLINFWATWCGPCRVEVPDLVEMQEELRDDGLLVIGVAWGEDADTIRPFAEEHSINYPLVPDPERRIDPAFGGVYGLPTTILIDPDGREIERTLGLFSVEDMTQRIREILAETT